MTGTKELSSKMALYREIKMIPPRITRTTKVITKSAVKRKICFDQKPEQEKEKTDKKRHSQNVVFGEYRFSKIIYKYNK